MKLPRVIVGGLELVLIKSNHDFNLSYLLFSSAPELKRTCTVRARPDSIEQQMSYLFGSLRRRDYSEEKIFDVEDALREAFANGLKHVAGFDKEAYVRDPHNYHDDSSKAMTMQWRLETNGVLIVKVDYGGPGFDVDKELTPHLHPSPDNLLLMRGRGHQYLRQTTGVAAYANGGRTLYMAFLLGERHPVTLPAQLLNMAHPKDGA